MLQSNRVLGSILVWFNSMFCWPLDAKTGYNDFWRQFFWMNVGFVPETIVLILSWLVSGSWCTEISYSWPCPKKFWIMDPYIYIYEPHIFITFQSQRNQFLETWGISSSRQILGLELSAEVCRFVWWQRTFASTPAGARSVRSLGSLLAEKSLLVTGEQEKDNRITHAC